MTAVQTIEHEHEEVLEPLDLKAAKALDGRITSAVDGIGDRLALLGQYLKEAEQGQIHRALDFDSWPAYLQDRLQGRWALKGEDRRRAALMLAEHGVATRAIGEIVGASKSQVARDIAEASVPNGTVNPQPELLGSDGEAAASAATSVPNGTELPEKVINTRTGKPQRRPQPKPKGDKPRRRPNVRKGFAHMAVQVGGWADGLRDMDPAELVVDAEVQKEIGAVVEGIAAIRKFLDGVKPARKAQPLTVFRWKAKELTPIIADLEALTKDPRWSKARERFNDKDRVALDTHIAALQELRAAGDDAEVAR